MLPSNLKKIIEQAKFNYSSLGKGFEKRTKAIKDQGEEQVKAITGNNSNGYSYENELLLSKKKEIFKNIYKEGLDKIEGLSKKLIIII